MNHRNIAICQSPLFGTNQKRAFRVKVYFGPISMLRHETETLLGKSGVALIPYKLFSTRTNTILFQKCLNQPRRKQKRRI